MTEDRIERLKSLMYAMVGTLERADCSTGECCCGDPMENHDSGMLSGHAPVDMGVYHAEALVEEARKELKLLENEN